VGPDDGSCEALACDNARGCRAGAAGVSSERHAQVQLDILNSAACVRSRIVLRTLLLDSDASAHPSLPYAHPLGVVVNRPLGVA